MDILQLINFLYNYIADKRTDNGQSVLSVRGEKWRKNGQTGHTP